MTGVRISLLVLLLLAGCDKVRGEPASLEDVTKVLEALSAAGCTAIRQIDVDRDGYEIEGATCEDGKSYDMKLDKKFAVVSKREDRL